MSAILQCTLELFGRLSLRFKSIQPSGFFLSLLFPLVCAVPARLQAQAFGVPSVTASTIFWAANGEYLSITENPNGNAAVYAWCEWGTDTSYGSATSPVLCGNGPSYGFDAEAYGLTPNTLYHYRGAASNYLGTGYSSDATFVSAGGPVITSQPQSQAVAAGSSVTFTVGAYSGLSIDYQWQKNGSNIASATSSSYTIMSAQPSDAGSYVAVVSNVYEGGWVVSSSAASLNVGWAPQPVLQSCVTNGALAFSWPVYVPGYLLQTATNLSAANWSTVVGAVTNGNTVTATVPVSDAQHFFRLQFP